MSSKVAMRLYADDVVELLDAFPDRRFRNLDIEEKLGKARAKYFSQKMRKFHCEGIIRKISLCDIPGHRNSRLWEIPMNIADYARTVHNGEKPKRVRCPQM